MMIGIFEAVLTLAWVSSDVNAFCGVGRSHPFATTSWRRRPDCLARCRCGYDTSQSWLGVKRRQSWSLAAAAAQVVAETWLPLDVDDAELSAIEREAVDLCAVLIQKRLNGTLDHKYSVPECIKGQFMDLSCEPDGEELLESLFTDSHAGEMLERDQRVLLAAAAILQSLCIFAMQLGLKGTPEQLERQFSHLDPRNDPAVLEHDFWHWNRDSVRRLKFRRDRAPALRLLAALQWKQSTQGAFDLLVRLDAWSRHEDLALIRSGFPLRFLSSEEAAARNAGQYQHDPDQILGLRKDLRGLKVYTIDSASTSEIDDGLSMELYHDADGMERRRVWIHIADADRWAPRNSTLFGCALSRGTSIYLSTGVISMFPAQVRSEVMSLTANQDVCAMSMSVELKDDGSIRMGTIDITPSLINVNYRLTYDEVDEMLEEGVGYREEWELGALLSIAQIRRDHRIRNGSAEGMVPRPIPQSSVNIYEDRAALDGIGISLKVEVSHNAGYNQTESQTAGSNGAGSARSTPAPVSSAFLLVTECMILAGEALGQWKEQIDLVAETTTGASSKNKIRLPFRTQSLPDFRSRGREHKIMIELHESNVGDGLCQAWYTRRFLSNVRIQETSKPHAGLGLPCYVQWSSPIRRLSDLQVHAAVKRYLRRKRVHELWKAGQNVPANVTYLDLGWPMGLEKDPRLFTGNELDQDIDYMKGGGLIGAARTLQRHSQHYWLLEYVRRQHVHDAHTSYTATVLGCIDPVKQQYAIYVHELGLEHRYTSPGKLEWGTVLKLWVDTVHPRNGILTFVRRV